MTKKLGGMLIAATILTPTASGAQVAPAERIEIAQRDDRSERSPRGPEVRRGNYRGDARGERERRVRRDAQAQRAERAPRDNRADRWRERRGIDRQRAEQQRRADRERARRGQSSIGPGEREARTVRGRERGHDVREERRLNRYYGTHMGRQWDRDRDGRVDRQWDRNNNGRVDRRYDRNRDGDLDRRWDRNNDNRVDRRYDRNRDGYVDRRYRDNRRGGWNRDWRSDRRYDWRAHRQTHRHYYRLPRYYAPYRDHRYTRFSIGLRLGSLFYGPRYWINDPLHYRLPPAYGDLRWIRYYDDALLVDVYSGEVVDVIYDFFW